MKITRHIGTRLLVALLVTGIIAPGCAGTQSPDDQTPEVRAAVEAAAKERHRAETQWQDAQKALRQAVAVDKFMMQNSGSAEESKDWSLVARTHETWVNDSPDEFAAHFQDSCVPSVIDGFDKAGLQMIQFGKELAHSSDVQRQAMSPRLISYGGDLSDLKVTCERVQQQLAQAKAEQAAAANTNAAPIPAQTPDEQHPYARLAGQVIGAALVKGLVAGAAYLDYEAARNGTAPVAMPAIAPSPGYCQAVWDQGSANYATRGLADSGPLQAYRQQLISSGCSPASLR